MGNNEFSNIGEDIKNAFQDAMTTMDFHKLNQDIGNSVNDALREVKDSLNGGKKFNENQEIDISKCKPRGAYRNNREMNNNYQSNTNNGSGQNNNSANNTGNNSYQNKNNYSYNYSYVNKNNVNKNDVAMRKNMNPMYSVPKGKVASILFKVFGFTLFGVMAIPVFVLSIVTFIAGAIPLEVGGSVILLLSIFMSCGILMATKGITISRKLKRFNKYVGVLSGRMYCSMEELSMRIGESKKYVSKDLKKMIRSGMFPEAHIDNKKTCFMLNYDTYKQYLKAEEGMKKREMEEKIAKNNEGKIEQENKKETVENSQVDSIILEGRAYINEIREANDAIYGEEISKKLDRMEQVTSKIFAYVEQHTEQIPDIRKFMEYYLPTTLKLVTAYREFEAQPVQGDNISTAKKEIQKTLDTINTAFENLLDSLFEDAAFDISTDISVLETMFAQEGLTEKDFKNKKEK